MPQPPLAAAHLLRDALRRAGIPFVHWKSNDHLAAALAGETDIDIYVDPIHRSAFEQVMVDLGVVKMVSQPWASYPDVEDWLVFDDATGRFLHLHHHYALMTGLKRVKHLALPWGPVLMANLRQDKDSGWPIPAAEMEMLILLVRIWGKMPPQRRWFAPKIPAHIRRELDWLRGDAKPEELQRLTGEFFPGLDPAPILSLLQPGALTQSAILGVARQLNDRLREQFRMPWSEALSLAVTRNARMVLAKILRTLRPETRTGKTLPRGGMMIALLGSDGAGKSTVGRELKRWLRFKLDVHSYYMGSGDGGTHLLDWLRRGIRAVLGLFRNRTKKSSGGSRGKPLGFLGKTVELYQLVIMRHKVRLLRAARVLAGGGSMVLTDRYPQTQFFGMSDGPKIQGPRGFDWAARRELAYYAETRRLGPDLVLKLKVTPEVAHARKPDHDLAVIREKTAIIDALQFPQCAMVEIDASLPLEHVLLAAKRAIWKHLLQRAA